MLCVKCTALTVWLSYSVCVQALNNLQSTHAGFGFVNAENVFKVSIPSPHTLIDS